MTNVEKIAIDVENVKVNANKINDFIEIVENEKNKIDDINVENVEKNETNEISEVIMMIAKNEKFFFDFLQCLMRTCSYNLMLLKYFSKHRLQTNVFVFFFVIRVFFSRFVVVIDNFLLFESI